MFKADPVKQQSFEKGVWDKISHKFVPRKVILIGWIRAFVEALLAFLQAMHKASCWDPVTCKNWSSSQLTPMC